MVVLLPAPVVPYASSPPSYPDSTHSSTGAACASKSVSPGATDGCASRKGGASPRAPSARGCVRGESVRSASAARSSTWVELDHCSQLTRLRHACSHASPLASATLQVDARAATAAASHSPRRTVRTRVSSSSGSGSTPIAAVGELCGAPDAA
eukprot:6932978-Prymnesium_polylepis.1